MASIGKFLFDNSFDAAQAAAAAEPPPPSYGDADLAAARDQGYAEGRAAGRSETLAGIEREAATALAQIAARLGDANARFEDVRAHAIAGGIDVVAAVLRKAVPALARRNALAEIEGLVKDSLHALYDEPRIVVRAPDAIVAALQERIDGLAAASGFAGKVVLFGDPELAETDCRIEWADGGAERDIDGLLRRLDAAIDRATGGAAAPAP